VFVSLHLAHDSRYQYYHTITTTILSYFIEGLRAGLLLSVLVGPLVVMLLQLSLRRGTLAALAAALGIWISDVLLILLTYYGMGELNAVRDYAYFNETVGRGFTNKRGLLSAFAQGFVINTFNPFTIGFWPFFAATEIHGRGIDVNGALAVYAGLLLVLVVTDTVKVLAARKLREWLTPEVMRRVQRAGAVALALFGIALGVRVWW